MFVSYKKKVIINYIMLILKSIDKTKVGTLMQDIRDSKIIYEKYLSL